MNRNRREEWGGVWSFCRVGRLFVADGEPARQPFDFGSRKPPHRPRATNTRGEMKDDAKEGCAGITDNFCSS